ncbi:UDP-N-acetylglucosamine 2-epimerase (non-hydrolysing) [Hathewaya proteolytica DSM 3090]|uniref:UDP-N-acetylglucosamine 2-epimerase (non-hydrolyzing) n=1 Tax=Hathewaya proteolytica DSM 3090 TaxID=1121331 RepID=A0A1M6MS48_9CLOT|nr:UDP-N-acetylglucosamine 2-epimerase (non-hydrolyzing) [Hathewaya proteolytica]SHJ86328.1 UDP-N-acetylglucosamine 2-epimerase (non-hydrolysing) [Hathewaya proteolytica DSM 3090]
MKPIKAMAIFGTRPEAIKMCPLIKELQERNEFQCKICVTAQHRQMLDQVLELFKLTPDYDLNIMKNKQTLTTITTSILEELDKIFADYRPDLILVHGDTTTTFASALSGFYNKITIGHVEAGLRTYNKYSPFPEEINRVLTGHLCDLHFAPTITSKENLLRENIKDNIFITGNTVIDAMKSTVEQDYVFENETLKNIDFENKKVLMVTAHRRENLGAPLENICHALKNIADAYEDVEVVYLVHLNPLVQNTAKSILGNTNNVHLLPPLDLKETHNLMNKSYMILSDSGGIQEEAPHLGKPVLVMRDTTERPEAVKAGTVKLVGTDKEEIFHTASTLITDKKEYDSMSNAVNPYGDGNASKRIADSILYYYKLTLEKPEDFSPEIIK